VFESAGFEVGGFGDTSAICRISQAFVGQRWGFPRQRLENSEILVEFTGFGEFTRYGKARRNASAFA
jgi:hypothetical protein